MDMKEIANEMKLLQEKADKYDDLKASVEGTMVRIDEKFKEVQDLITDLAPVLSLKKKYKYAYDPSKGKSYGNKSIELVSDAYKYLIESGKRLSIPNLIVASGHTGISGASEHKIRIGLKLLKGIKIDTDNNDSRVRLYYFDKSIGKLDLDSIGNVLREEIKKKEDIRVDIVDDKKELSDAMPKKYTQMG